MCDSFELGSMTEDENRMAVEAQIRTLNILHDALNKKEWLLAETGRDYTLQAPNVPIICPQLVEDLIQTVQRVELLKYNGTKYETGASTIYPAPSAPVIGLSPEFWKRHENLSFFSRPGALILAAAYILGYYGGYDKSWLVVGMEENQKLVLSGSHICAAFEVWMRHKGKYVNGCYTCCGEKSLHSVCEYSDIRFLFDSVMDEEQMELVETSRKATLMILLDAKNKGLFVDNAHLTTLQQPMVKFPLIPRTLITDLIKKLNKVTFKSDKKPRNEALIAYPGPQSQDVIYLCPFFWKQSDQLRPGSRIGTLILSASQMLGYSHVLNWTSSPEKPMGHQVGHLLMADDICAAFEQWMMHRGHHMDGSYSCCGEKNKDSVCRESLMGSGLRQCLPEVNSIIDGNVNFHYGDIDTMGSPSMTYEDDID